MLRAEFIKLSEFIGIYLSSAARTDPTGFSLDIIAINREAMLHFEVPIYPGIAFNEAPLKNGSRLVHDGKKRFENEDTLCNDVARNTRANQTRDLYGGPKVESTSYGLLGRAGTCSR
jgi:hypothetical protein